MDFHQTWCVHWNSGDMVWDCCFILLVWANFVNCWYLSVHFRSVFTFLDYNFSKYLWIFTKLGIWRYCGYLLWDCHWANFICFWQLSASNESLLGPDVFEVSLIEISIWCLRNKQSDRRNPIHLEKKQEKSFKFHLTIGWKWQKMASKTWQEAGTSRYILSVIKEGNKIV